MIIRSNGKEDLYIKEIIEIEKQLKFDIMY